MSRRAPLLIGVLVVAALVAAVVWLWPPERSACCGPSPAHTTGGGAETVLRTFDLSFGGGFGALASLTHVDTDTTSGNTKYRLNVIQVGGLEPGNTAPIVRQVSLFATQFKR